jgi:hypothetical protein
VEPGLKETSIVAVRELPAAAVTDGLYNTNKVQVLAFLRERKLGPGQSHDGDLCGYMNGC